MVDLWRPWIEEKAQAQLAGALLENNVPAPEVQSLLSGETDANNAICSLQAGAGGTDAQDFCQMLLRMYIRWAERKGYTVTLLDEQEGEKAFH